MNRRRPTSSSPESKKFVPRIEQLETRLVPTVKAIFSGGLLLVTATGPLDNIVIRDPGTSSNILVNGHAPLGTSPTGPISIQIDIEKGANHQIEYHYDATHLVAPRQGSRTLVIDMAGSKNELRAVLSQQFPTLTGQPIRLEVARAASGPSAHLTLFRVGHNPFSIQFPEPLRPVLAGPSVEVLRIAGLLPPNRVLAAISPFGVPFFNAFPGASLVGFGGTLLTPGGQVLVTSTLLPFFNAVPGVSLVGFGGTLLTPGGQVLVTSTPFPFFNAFPGASLAGFGGTLLTPGGEFLGIATL
jgi:hypothetical protein